MRGADPVDAGATDVVVPSFNHGAFVEECLRSIFAQTVAPAFLLVIDDGSKDDSVAVIERTLGDCPFPCELVVRPNRGLCATLNEGLSRTSSPFFTYLGSDDFWAPERLERSQAALLAEPEAVACYSHYFICDAAGALLTDSREWAQFPAEDMFTALISLSAIPQTTTVTYRRSALVRHSWDEASRLEDYGMYLRLARDGPFAFVPEPLGYWRQHASNTSKQLAVVVASVLADQQRTGLDAGLSRDAIRRYQGGAQLGFADFALALGQRFLAARLVLGGARHARSRRHLLRQLRRLVTPIGRIDFPPPFAPGGFGKAPLCD